MEPPSPRPKPRAGRWLLTLLRIAAVAAALIALGRLVSAHDFARARALVVQVGWSFAFVLIPTLVAMALDAVGWKRILRTLGHVVPWRRMLELRLAVEALVLSLPGGSVAGEAAKIALLGTRAGVPATHGAASLALTKACLTVTDALYLALAAAWATADRLAGGSVIASWPAQVAVGGAVFTGVVGVALFAMLRDASMATRLVGHVRRLPIARLRRWLDARHDQVRELDESVNGFFTAPLLVRLGCIIPFGLEWLVEGAETAIILHLLHVPLGVGGILLLDGVGSLLRAMAFFVPAGLGVQDAAMLVLLRALGVADPAAAGTALIVIKRTKEVFWVVAGSLFWAGTRDQWRRSIDRAL